MYKWHYCECFQKGLEHATGKCFACYKLMTTDQYFEIESYDDEKKREIIKNLTEPEEILGQLMMVTDISHFVLNFYLQNLAEIENNIDFPGGDFQSSVDMRVIFSVYPSCLDSRKDLNTTLKVNFYGDTPDELRDSLKLNIREELSLYLHKFFEHKGRDWFFKVDGKVYDITRDFFIPQKK